MRILAIEQSLAKGIAKVLKYHQADWQLRLKHLSHEASVINKIRKSIPDGWVPLRLAASCYLTQGSKVNNIIMPHSMDDWCIVWEEIRPQVGESKKQLQKRFKNWLIGRRAARNAEKFSLAYVDYWESRNFDIQNSHNDLIQYDNLKDRMAISCFWKQFKWVGDQYAKNIPMDEKHKLFTECIKVDSRLKKIVYSITGSTLRDSEVEQIYLNAGNKNGLNGWQTDRLCFNFSKVIFEAIKK